MTERGERTIRHEPPERGDESLVRMPTEETAR
jgi:hypothetical protein